jgi:hypothetical protein
MHYRYLNATKEFCWKRYIAFAGKSKLRFDRDCWRKKYIKLTNAYPNIISRMPQHMIVASYLVSPRNTKPLGKQIHL